MTDNVQSYISEWAAEVEEAWANHKRSAWYVADLIMDGIEEWGHMIKPDILIEELAMQLNCAPKTLSNYYRVSKGWPVDQRIDALEFGHHEALLSVKDGAERLAWAVQCMECMWSVHRLRLELRRRKADSAPTQADLALDWLKEAGILTTRSNKRVQMRLPSGRSIILESESDILFREAHNE
jgi:hypothetical protein